MRDCELWSSGEVAQDVLTLTYATSGVWVIWRRSSYGQGEGPGAKLVAA